MTDKVEKMQGIPQSDIGTEIEIAKASGATSTEAKLEPNGTYTLIATYSVTNTKTTK